MTLYSSEKKGNTVWETGRKTLKDHYRWKMWEHDNFLQCGVRVDHQKKTEVFFCHRKNEFIDELKEIQISSQRRKEKDSPVRPQEQTELRGTPGWCGQL